MITIMQERRTNNTSPHPANAGFPLSEGEGWSKCRGRTLFGPFLFCITAKYNFTGNCLPKQEFACLQQAGERECKITSVSRVHFLSFLQLYQHPQSCTSRLRAGTRLNLPNHRKRKKAQWRPLLHPV